MKRLIASTLTLVSLAGPAAGAAALDYAALEPGTLAHRFKATTIYLDAADRPMGARFVHGPTGFQLDLIAIESVPQSFTWVKTFAVSDQGEPHTQEHLLLLRGVSGRRLATRQGMSIASTNAYTETWRTSYMMSTSAGIDTFFELFAEQQHAMLHPDYSDAEIRLEVRNFGVTRAADGTLRLEEKGPVYNEMVSSMASAGAQAWRAQSHAVYGTRHPLAFNQGGEPAGIRTMTPEDIRRFHATTHHLANMGAVAAFPRSAALADLLARFDRVLMADAPRGGSKPRRADSLARLPPPAGDPEGASRIYEYPHFNEQQPSPVSLVWPASRSLDAFEQVLAELFFSALAGDSSARLYGLLIDSASRKLDLGAQGISASVGLWGGHPVEIELSRARPASLTQANLHALRALVMREIERIAALPDGSPELKAFNEVVAGHATARAREAVKFIGTPPGFGARGGNSAWPDLLLLLERSPGTRKSLVMKREFARIRALLASGRNPWRERLARWRITGVAPYIVGARPNPALIAREQAEREQRLAAETERLKQRYATADAQQALARFAADAEAEFARIEESTRVPPTPFVAAPPMTLDDGIEFEVRALAGGVPLVASRFESMTGAMTGIALSAAGVPREELRALSLLPDLLTSVGVIDDAGRPLSHEQVSERLRREVLSLDARFSTQVRTGRVELVMKGSGVGLEESRGALEWMARFLHAPDWRPENLPRLRDVVEQRLAALRSTPQRAEEAWVNDPAQAWMWQRRAAWLAAASFQTRAYHALRLRWQLFDPAPADRDAVRGFLARLAESGRGLDRARLKTLLAAGQGPEWDALTTAQRTLAGLALRDLDLSLADMPDPSLGADFAELALALSEDLATPAAQALARLESLRRRLLRAGGARLFMAAPRALQDALAQPIAAFVHRLDAAPFTPQPDAAEGQVSARLAQRGAAPTPAHVGLHVQGRPGGVILTSVPVLHYGQADERERVLDYLATRLYAGHGSHGVFSKTVGAGLAYSNGLRGTVSAGTVGYYAERTPELPQTVRFVNHIVRSGMPDGTLGEYVVAQAFAESRAAQAYEARAEGIAADIADGQPPAAVRRFRERVLELRRDPALVERLFERKDRVHARLLPGYAAGGLDHERGSFMVIGPDRQLDAWERFLQESDGAGTRLQRLYARDFWMP